MSGLSQTQGCSPGPGWPPPSKWAWVISPGSRASVGDDFHQSSTKVQYLCYNKRHNFDSKFNGPFGHDIQLRRYLRKKRFRKISERTVVGKALYYYINSRVAGLIPTRTVWQDFHAPEPCTHYTTVAYSLKLC